MKDLFATIVGFCSENSKIINLIAGLLILLLFVLLRKKLAYGISNLIAKLAARNDEKKREPLINSLFKPLSAFFAVLGIFICVYLNYRHLTVIKAFKIAVILIICWGLVNYLSNNLFLILHIKGNQDDKINITVVKFISNILKVIIVAFAVVMVISELGYNINGLITGIGVGGLAVSLAAQDAVSNLISGFIIVVEKPFGVGDFVKVHDIVGTVDDVAMRSTRIRTLDDCLVTIPNSSIANDPIINYSKIEHRLLDLEFGLTYSTSNELLKKCQDDIKDYLINDEEIVPSPVRVEFTKLDDSSLNLNVFCYATQSDMHEYQRVLSKINYKIKEIIESNGAEFAFPSSSIYIEKK